METIITSNLSNITLSTKLVIFGKDDSEVKIDIAKLFKGDEAYVEVTKISKVYGKRFTDWTRLEDTKRYIKELEGYLNLAHLRGLKKDENLKGQKSDPLENGEILNSSYMSVLKNDKSLNSPHLGGLKNTKNNQTKVKSPLIIRRAGRYNSGTWLHRKLALKYFRWLDVKFEIAIDMFLEQVYKQVEVVKVNRNDTKTLFHPLTDSIKNIYIPNQLSENSKKFAYANLLDMINLKVLGMRARDFRKANNIPAKNNIYTRDYMSETQLKNIKKFQSHLNSLISAGFTDYNQLKEFITNIPL